jgi:hypothetical protein
MIIQVIIPHWGTPLASALSLDESQIARAAEDMIWEYGDEALTKADDRVKKLKFQGVDSIAKTWELIREVIKDMQESGDKNRWYLPINSLPCRGKE